jgi:hypothetical protein
MPKQAKRAERLVAAFRKLHRVEEMKKIALQRQLNELQRSQEDILIGLNREDALQGVFLQTSTRYLRKLAREAERVSQSHLQQSRRLLDRAGKLRRAEKMRDELSQLKERAEGTKQLTEVLERYGGKGDASLP